MLPPDFRWDEMGWSVGPNIHTWLYVGDKCVAQVSRRLDGTWFITANRHLAPSRWLHVNCSSRERGKWILERWAAANAQRLRTEPPYREDATAGLR